MLLRFDGARSFKSCVGNKMLFCILERASEEKLRWEKHDLLHHFLLRHFGLAGTSSQRGLTLVHCRENNCTDVFNITVRPFVANSDNIRGLHLFCVWRSCWDKVMAGQQSTDTKLWKENISISCKYTLKMDGGNKLCWGTFCSCAPSVFANLLSLWPTLLSDVPVEIPRNSTQWISLTIFLYPKKVNNFLNWLFLLWSIWSKFDTLLPLYFAMYLLQMPSEQFVMGLIHFISDLFRTFSV